MVDKFNVAIPAIVHAGAGNDHVNAGGGAAVLLGDEGDDTIIGGGGRDILIGAKDDDVLIGGTIDSSDDDAALLQLLSAWTNDDSYGDRVNAVDLLLAVTDDELEDYLTGSADQDLFYDGLSDVLDDVKTNKDPETVL